MPTENQTTETVQKPEPGQKPELEVKLNADTLYAFITGIENIVDEANLRFTRAGVEVMAMHASSISMVKAGIPSNMFSKYILSKDEVNLGLNIENIAKLIPKKDAEVGLTLEGEKLRIRIYEKANIKEEAIVNKLEVKKSVEKAPNIDYKVRMSIDGKLIKDSLRKANLISGYIAFTNGQEGLKLDAKGDGGELSKLISRDVFKKYSVAGSELQTAVFNLEFLIQIVKLADKNTTLDIAYKSNDPVFLAYEVYGTKLSYFLAPYMEE